METVGNQCSVEDGSLRMNGVTYIIPVDIYFALGQYPRRGECLLLGKDTLCCGQLVY